MLQDEYLFDYPEALDKIDELSQSDIKELRDNFLKNIAIDCSIMGNVLEQQSADYAEILKNKLITGAGQSSCDTLQSFLQRACPSALTIFLHRYPQSH
jgi:secreted Zn-dependent insulinase-like peptidase